MGETKLNIVRIVVMAVGGQKALAEKVGTTQQYVSKWCNQGYVPDAWVEKVAEASGFQAEGLRRKDKGR